jgi:hypothetical protein
MRTSGISSVVRRWPVGASVVVPGSALVVVDAAVVVGEAVVVGVAVVVTLRACEALDFVGFDFVWLGGEKTALTITASTINIPIPTTACFRLIVFGVSFTTPTLCR